MPVSSAAAEQPSPAGRDINITWWYTFLSVAGMSVFLLGIASVASVALISSLDGPTWQSVVVLGLYISSAVPCVYASWLLRDHYGSGWPAFRVTAALLAVPALCWVVTVFIPGATLYGAIPLWMILSITLALLRSRQRLLVLAIGVLLLILHGVLNPGTAAFFNAQFLISLVFYVVLTPSTFVFSAWFWRLIVRLDEARTVSGQLAVARERLRFASDLHDIQGHHLQVIALKAELADRFLASDTPKHQQAAQDAIREVRSMAEQAQLETRQLVRDLRVVSLSDELENAKDVLEAAGVTTTVHADEPAVDSHIKESNRLLGFMVREATTNILRHAQAHHVTIELTTDDALHLKIRNDSAARPSEPTEHTQGTGLDGLRTRFEQAGGALHTDQEQNMFTLHAILPNVVEDAT